MLFNKCNRWNICYLVCRLLTYLLPKSNSEFCHVPNGYEHGFTYVTPRPICIHLSANSRQTVAMRRAVRFTIVYVFALRDGCQITTQRKHRHAKLLFSITVYLFYVNRTARFHVFLFISSFFVFLRFFFFFFFF